jgi:hypothetical protein
MSAELRKRLRQAHPVRSRPARRGALSLPDSPLRNHERLARCFQLIHTTPPSKLPVDRVNQSRTTRPLRSTPITGASPLLRVGPPARSATVLNSSRLRTARNAPSHPPNSSGQFPHAPSPVPHESRRPGSRRLYAGHRLASKLVPARLIPGQSRDPGFDATF